MSEHGHSQAAQDKEISRSNLASFAVPTPTTFEEQEAIGQFISSIEPPTITHHQRELEKLKNLKKACLEKMFRLRQERQR
jgi:type I restriction enzyme S subunit